MAPNNRMELTASRCASQSNRCSFSPVVVPAAAHPERSTDRDGSDGGVDVSEIGSAYRIGRRVVVTGMAGAGKSTFARQLAVKTGLPVIHLDVHFWKPGWVESSDTEWRAVQSTLLA